MTATPSCTERLRSTGSRASPDDDWVSSVRVSAGLGLAGGNIPVTVDGTRICALFCETCMGEWYSRPVVVVPLEPCWKTLRVFSSPEIFDFQDHGIRMVLNVPEPTCSTRRSTPSWSRRTRATLHCLLATQFGRWTRREHRCTFRRVFRCRRPIRRPRGRPRRCQAERIFAYIADLCSAQYRMRRW